MRESIWAPEADMRKVGLGIVLIPVLIAVVWVCFRVDAGLAYWLMIGITAVESALMLIFTFTKPIHPRRTPEATDEDLGSASAG